MKFKADDGQATHTAACGCQVCGNPDTYRRGSMLSRRQALAAMSTVLAGAGLVSTGKGSFAASPALQWSKDQSKAPHRDCVIVAGAALIWENGAPVVKHNVQIRVHEDRIVEISEGEIRSDAPKVDASGHLVMPGFISGHTHVSVGSYTRTVIEGGGGTAAPHAVVEAFDDETMDDLMAFNLLELIRSGVTTVINQDHNVRRAYSYVRVASRWAARGYPSGMIPGVHRLSRSGAGRTTRCC